MGSLQNYIPFNLISSRTTIEELWVFKQYIFFLLISLLSKIMSFFYFAIWHQCFGNVFFCSYNIFFATTIFPGKITMKFLVRKML